MASGLDCIPFHLQSDKDYVVFVPQDVPSTKQMMPLCDVIYTAYKMGIPVIQLENHSLEQKKRFKACHALHMY